MATTVARFKNDNVKHLYLQVQGDKYNFFVELVKSLGFVKIESEKTLSAKREKERVFANIRQGFIDKKSIENGTLKTFPIEDLFDD